MSRHNTLAHEANAQGPPPTQVARAHRGGEYVAPTGPSPEAVRRLEEARFPVPIKINALLVGLGEKPATSYRFMSRTWSAGKAPQDLDDISTKEYVDAVRELGVYVEVGTDRTVNPWAEYTKGSDGERVKHTTPDWETRVAEASSQVWRTVFVAQSPEAMELIKTADDQNDVRLLGKAYGFPETATEAYIHNRIISPRDAGEKDPSTIAFARYGLSPESAQDELAVARQWAAAVQDASPRLYEEMTRYDLAHGNARTA